MSRDKAQRGRTKKRKADKSLNPILEPQKCDNVRAKTDQSRHYISRRSPRLESYWLAKQACGGPYKTTENGTITRAGY